MATIIQNLGSITNPDSNTTITDSNGDYILTLYGSNDLIKMGNGFDQVYLWGYNDTITLGNGDDYIEAHGNNETITAGNGNDTVIIDGGTSAVTSGTNTINLGNGNDTITIQGNSWNNTITAGNGSDIINITGFSHNNIINVGNGGVARDVLNITGSSFNDTITFGNGNNVLNLSGQTNQDIVKVGNGQNIINITAAGMNDVVTAGNGGNYINDAGTGNSVTSGNGNDTLVYNASDVLEDAGGGFNTLLVTSHQTSPIDLTIANSPFKNFQLIDLTGTGLANSTGYSNELDLSPAAVDSLTGKATNPFNGLQKTMVVLASNSDILKIGNGWTEHDVLSGAPLSALENLLSPNGQSIVPTTVTLSAYRVFNYGADTLIVNDTPPLAQSHTYVIPETPNLNLLSYSMGNIIIDTGDKATGGTPLHMVSGIFNDTANDGNTLTVNADGTFLYKINTLINGIDTFNYTVSDGLLSSSSTVVFKVIDTAPVAKTVSYNVTEASGQTYPEKFMAGNILTDSQDTAGGYGLHISTGTFNDTANDGNTLSISADGSFVYQVNNPFIGSDVFNYSINDGLLSSSSTITFNVHDTAPVANQIDDSITRIHSAGIAIVSDNILLHDTPGGGPLTHVTQINGQNLNGGPLTITTAHGVLSVLDDVGDYQYTNNHPFTGVDSFTYTISDGLLTASNIINIHVTDNVTPVISSITGPSSEIIGSAGETWNITLDPSLSDEPFQVLIPLNVQPYFSVTENGANNQWLITQTAPFTSLGIISFGVTATDTLSGNFSIPKFLTFNVTGPAAADDSYSYTYNNANATGANGSNAFSETGLLSNDTQGGGNQFYVNQLIAYAHVGDAQTSVLSISNGGSAVGYTADGNQITLNSDGSFSFVQQSTYHGTFIGSQLIEAESFQYDVSNGVNTSLIPATVNLNITDSTFPVISGVTETDVTPSVTTAISGNSITVTEIAGSTGETWQINVVSNALHDPYTYLYLGQPGFSIDASTGIITQNMAFNQNGTSAVQEHGVVKVVDLSSSTATGNIPFTVNVIPGFTLSSNSFDFGSVQDGATSSQQTETISIATGDSVAISNLSGANASDFTVTANSPSNGQETVTLTFTPSTAGTESASFDVVDQYGNTQTVNLTGVGINQAPQIALLSTPNNIIPEEVTTSDVTLLAANNLTINLSQGDSIAAYQVLNNGVVDSRFAFDLQNGVVLKQGSSVDEDETFNITLQVFDQHQLGSNIVSIPFTVTDPFVITTTQISDQAVVAGAAITPITLSQYFHDQDTFDGGTVTYALINPPSTLSIVNGVLQGTAPAAGGQFVITVQASDSDNHTASQSFAITSEAAQFSPRADHIQFNNNGTVTIYEQNGITYSPPLIVPLSQFQGGLNTGTGDDTVVLPDSGLGTSTNTVQLTLGGGVGDLDTVTANGTGTFQYTKIVEGAGGNKIDITENQVSHDTFIGNAGSSTPDPITITAPTISNDTFTGGTADYNVSLIGTVTSSTITFGTGGGELLIDGSASHNNITAVNGASAIIDITDTISAGVRFNTFDMGKQGTHSITIGDLVNGNHYGYGNNNFISRGGNDTLILEGQSFFNEYTIDPTTGETGGKQTIYFDNVLSTTNFVSNHDFFGAYAGEQDIQTGKPNDVFAQNIGNDEFATENPGALQNIYLLGGNDKISLQTTGFDAYGGTQNIGLSNSVQDNFSTYNVSESVQNILVQHNSLSDYFYTNGGSQNINLNYAAGDNFILGAGLTTVSIANSGGGNVLVINGAFNTHDTIAGFITGITVTDDAVAFGGSITPSNFSFVNDGTGHLKMVNSAGGSIDFTDVNYTPAAGLVASTAFSGNYQISLNVPIAVNDTVFITQNGTVSNTIATGNVLSNDSTTAGTLSVTQLNGNALTGSSVALAHGSVILHSDGTFTYTEAVSGTYQDSFQYTVTNGTTSTTATAYIKVQDVVGPSISSITGQTSEDETANGGTWQINMASTALPETYQYSISNANNSALLSDFSINQNIGLITQTSPVDESLTNANGQVDLTITAKNTANGFITTKHLLITIGDNDYDSTASFTAASNIPESTTNAIVATLVQSHPNGDDVFNTLVSVTDSQNHDVTSSFKLNNGKLEMSKTPEEGTYSYTVTVKNAEGYQSPSSTLTFTVIDSDLDPHPTLSLPNYLHTNLTLPYYLIDGHTAHVHFHLNQAYPNGDDVYKIPVSVTPVGTTPATSFGFFNGDLVLNQDLQAGDYQYNIVMADSEGDKATINLKFTVNQLDPNLVIPVDPSNNLSEQAIIITGDELNGYTPYDYPISPTDSIAVTLDPGQTGKILNYYNGDYFYLIGDAKLSSTFNIGTGVITLNNSTTLPFIFEYNNPDTYTVTEPAIGTKDFVNTDYFAYTPSVTKDATVYDLSPAIVQAPSFVGLNLDGGIASSSANGSDGINITYTLNLTHIGHDQIIYGGDVDNAGAPGQPDSANPHVYFGGGGGSIFYTIEAGPGNDYIEVGQVGYSLPVIGGEAGGQVIYTIDGGVNTGSNPIHQYFVIDHAPTVLPSQYGNFTFVSPNNTAGDWTNINIVGASGIADNVYDLQVPYFYGGSTGLLTIKGQGSFNALVIHQDLGLDSYTDTANGDTLNNYHLDPFKNNIITNMNLIGMKDDLQPTGVTLKMSLDDITGILNSAQTGNHTLYIDGSSIDHFILKDSSLPSSFTSIVHNNITYDHYTLSTGMILNIQHGIIV